MIKTFLPSLAATLLLLPHGWACTNILVTPEATTDGSSMIAYNADDEALMGMLYHYPPSHGNDGKERKIYEWDTGKYLGNIAEAVETYNVVGNINEHGLCISETTFGGVSLLWEQKNAVMDYGSLIYVTLQRSKTAREAIHTMAELTETYGYYSSGESFSLADPSGEVWIMEMIGTGNTYGRMGAVWVARRLPPGYISSHANQARITTFPRDDPENCLYAEDVVDVAIHYELFPADGNREDFSFSDVYAPLNFMAARSCEARVWSVFSALADDEGKFQDEYLEYAAGRDLSYRMPLWIKPYKKLSLQDMSRAMASHYEGTELDPTKDPGAGLYGSPQRPRPLEWTYEGKTYHNERPISIAKTGWNFIAQVRPWMPPELAAMKWFGVDDSSTSPRFPVYGSSRMISAAYSGTGPQDGVPSPILDLDLTKAFWVQNLVSNFAYFRWSDVYPLVRNKMETIEEVFIADVAKADKQALALLEKNPAAAIDYISNFGVVSGDYLHEEWTKFFGFLFTRFRDYYTIMPKESDPVCGCEVEEPGLSDAWKKRIVKETGNHFIVVEDKGSLRKPDKFETLLAA